MKAATEDVVGIEVIDPVGNTVNRRAGDNIQRKHTAGGQIDRITVSDIAAIVVRKLAPVDCEVRRAARPETNLVEPTWGICIGGQSSHSCVDGNPGITGGRVVLRGAAGTPSKSGQRRAARQTCCTTTTDAGECKHGDVTP